MHMESYFRLDWLGVALWLWLNEDGTIIIFNRIYYFGLDQLTRTEDGQKRESKGGEAESSCVRELKADGLAIFKLNRFYLCFVTKY